MKLINNIDLKLLIDEDIAKETLYIPIKRKEIGGWRGSTIWYLIYFHVFAERKTEEYLGGNQLEAKNLSWFKDRM